MRYAALAHGAVFVTECAATIDRSFLRGVDFFLIRVNVHVFPIILRVRSGTGNGRYF